MKIMKILDNLNKRQIEAVMHVKGPLLVVAGAGSGKTLVLTRRIANLINEGISPENILAVTFTNKAAKEMHNRIKTLLGERYSSRPLVGTFHSIGARMLRQDMEILNRNKDFTIFDSDDSSALCRQICRDLGITKDKYHPKAILSRISAAKNGLLTASIFSSKAVNNFDETVASVFERYESQLLKMNACDFDDLLILPALILKKFPEVLDSYQEKWRFLLIDEFQDTNFVQNLFVKMLAEKYLNVCAIGDSDQAIYSFRGAKPENILKFAKTFPGTKIIKLEQNYRSTQNILDAANAVITNNQSRVPKSMFTESGAGEKINITECEGEIEEAQYVMQEIMNLRNKGELRYADFAILYRTNVQSRVFEEAALRYAIPYQIVGGVKFYARKEIKDVLAFLRFILNSNDRLSFLRILNIPSRKIGKVTVGKLQQFADQNNLNITEAISDVSTIDNITPNVKNGIADFNKKINSSRNMLSQVPVSQLIEFVLDEMNLENHYRDGSEDGEMRWENIKELISVATKFDGLNNGLELFLEEVALISEADNIEENYDRITLMTIHNAKGLEFPVIFVVGCEENITPHSRSMFTPDELEEERRLFYVAMTRAKQLLYLTYANSRLIFGDYSRNQSSRFLSEIPAEFINNEAPEQNSEEITLTPIFDDLPVNYFAFKINDFVKHPKFGRGTIRKVEGDILTIEFEAFGTKRLASSIAPLKKIKNK